MAFIKTTTNKEGRTHVYLVEGYRIDGKVKQRILHKFGLLEDLEKAEPDILERLKREAKAGHFDTEKTLEVSYALNAPIATPDQSYGWMVLDNLFCELGLPTYLKTIGLGVLTEVLKLLVFQRILQPDSKRATVQSQADLFGDWQVDLNQVYRGLTDFDKWKEDIQFHLHKRLTELTNRQATLVFYDVTNYYFETDLDDQDEKDEQGTITKLGLRRRGPSKEHRPKPIVQMGLFMDQNGIPISYQLFRGNQVDVSTYLPAIKQVKKQFGIERIVVVADKGMNSKDNISETLANKDGWIFSQKHRGRRGAPKDIQEQILATEGWHFNATETFAKKSYIRERRLGTKKSAPLIQEKVLITWNKKYAVREKIRREGALEYAQKLTNAELYRQTSKKGGKRYLDLTYLDPETGEIKPYSPLIQLDQEQVDFDAQFDGVNVIITSEIEMSDEAILDSYSQLSKIEDCFRVTQTEFSSRPVYVRTPEHIEGHFLTCFLGLVLIRLLQYRTDWQMSPERMIGALNSAKATPLKDDYYRLQENQDMSELNRLLGIDWTKGIVKYEQLKQYAKGSYTTPK